MLSMGMTGKMLTNYVGDGRLKSRVQVYRSGFPGATLTAKATITDIREEDGETLADIAVSTVDEEGTEVIKGQATALLD